MSDLNLGIRLKADGSGLVGEFRIVKKELDALQRDLGQVGKDARGAGGGLDRLNAGLSQTAGAAKATEAGVGRLGAELDQTINKTKATGAGLDHLSDELAGAGKEARATGKNFDRLGGDLDQAGKEARATEAGLDRLGAELDQTDRKAKTAGRGLDRMGKQTRGAGGAARNARQEFLNLKTALLGLGLAKIGGDATRMTLQMDRSGRALKFAAGSAEGYARDVDFLRRESERLGQVFVQQIELFGKLEAATRGTNLAGQATKDIYLGVTEAATVLQLSQEQVAGAMRAVEQIMSKGKVQAEELRGQLGERIPGAFQIAARAMGITTQELDKMLEQGKVISDDFLPKFAAQLRKEFGPGLEDAARSAQSEINRMVNVINDARVAFGTGFLDGLTDSTHGFKEALQELIDDGALADLGEGLGDITVFIADNLELIEALVVGYGSYRLAALALAPVVAGLTGGITALNAAMAANPVGLAAAAIGLTVAAVTQLIEKYDDLHPSEEKHQSALKDIETLARKAAAAEGEVADELERQLQKRIELERQRLGSELDNLDKKRALAEQRYIRPSVAGFSAGDPLGENHRAELREIDAEILSVMRSYAQLDSVADEAAASVKKVLEPGIDGAGNGGLAGEALDKLRQKLEDITNSLDPQLARYRELSEVVEAIGQAYDQGLIPSLEEYLRLLGLAQEKYYPSSAKFLAEINDQMADEVRLLTLSESERKIELKTRELQNAAKARGIVLGDKEIAQLRALAQTHVAATDAMERRVKAAEGAAEDLRRIWDTARENVQETLADTFDNFLQGNLDSVGDFWDSFKAIGRRAIAETLAAQVFQGSLLGGTAGGAGLFGGLFGGLFPGQQTAPSPTAVPGYGGGMIELNKGMGFLTDAINDFGSMLGFADPGLVGPLPAAGLGSMTLGGMLGGGLQGAFMGSMVADVLGIGGTGRSALTAGGIGLSLGGVAGGVGGAAGALLGDLLGLGRTGSAALSGAGIGFAVGGLPGAGIGAAIGAITSLFGGGTPESGVSISGNHYGTSARSSSPYAKSGGDRDAAGALGDAAVQFYNAILQIDRDGALKGDLGRLGIRDDEFFFRAPGGRRREFSSAESAIAAQLSYAQGSGKLDLSPIYDQILRASKGQDPDSIIDNLQFGKQYEDIINGRELNKAEEALTSLQEEFIATATRARDLGLNVHDLGAAFEEEALRLKEDFEKSIDIGILEFENPLEAQLQVLYDAQVERLEEARTLGADLVEVERLNMLERQAVIDDYSRQANRIIQGYSDDLERFMDDIRFGGSSQLSPTEQIGNAEARFGALYEAALGGDEAALGDIVDVAAELRNLYLGAFASTDQFFAAEGDILASLRSLEDRLGVDLGQVETDVPAATIENVFPDLVSGLDDMTDVISDGNITIASLLEEIRDWLTVNPPAPAGRRDPIYAGGRGGIGRRVFLR